MCGEIGLTPSEFYALQYSELALILEGYYARRKREDSQRRELSAWMVSWMLLPHRAKDAEPITPDQLLGRKMKARAKSPQFADSKAAAIAFFSALKAKSEGEVKTDA